MKKKNRLYLDLYVVPDPDTGRVKPIQCFLRPVQRRGYNTVNVSYEMNFTVYDVDPQYDELYFNQNERIYL